MLKAYHHTIYRLQSAMPRLLPGTLHTLPDRTAVAVTIDDGPVGENPSALLTYLAKEALTTTWFFSGEAVRRFPEYASEIAAGGHEVASHGFHHRSILRMADGQLRDDVRRSLDAIEEATGQRPAFYRPPYGRILTRQMSLIRALGCRVVLWSKLPGDWNIRLHGATMHSRLSSVRGGDIVVLHDRPGGQQRLIGHLRVLQQGMRRRGLRPISLAQSTGVK